MDLDSVLRQMRTEYTPSEGDRKRVENALTATILAGSVTGAAHLASGGSVGIKSAIAKGSLKLLPVWFKGAIGVGATVAAVGGGVYGVSQYQAQQPATVVVAPPSPAQTAAKIQAAPKVQAEQQEMLERIPEPAVIAEPTPAGPATVPDATQATSARAGLRQTPSRVGNANVQLTSLGELQLIGEASKALQEGRSEDAHKALREHERRYANTALGQERSGLALLARCASGDANAPSDATKFLQKTPNSPLATRIKRECRQ
jgi:hypothetical protein